MKKVLVLVMCMWAIGTFAQDSTKCEVSKYISVGISLTNGNNFLVDAYNSAEFGIVYKNLGVGAVLGRGTLKGLGSKNDSFDKYFYELKVAPSFPMGILSGNLILGYGGYFNSSHMFIEYGFGTSITQDKISYGLSYSNWDGVNYVSPSITFNF